MGLERTRIFVGNLPPNITEENVQKKFKDYGTVTSVEIKRNHDSSTFAFVDINTDNLEACFKALTCRKWKGYKVKMERAKESFLSRLSKERQLQQQGQMCKKVENETAAEATLERLDLSAGKRKESESGDEVPAFKSRRVDNSSDDSDYAHPSAGDQPCRGKLNMFCGTKQSLSTPCSNGNVAGEQTVEEYSETKQTSYDGIKTKHKAKETAIGASSKLLNKLESFSDVWKDSPEALSEPVYHVKGKSEPKGFYEKNKQTESENKRKKSVAERKEAIQQQKIAIKLGLSSVDSHAKPNKKIVFDSENEDTDHKEGINGGVDDSDSSKLVLFADDQPSDKEDENIDFEVKSQFEGVKGHKLLELKSRYANDRRFALDERFYDSDDNDSFDHSKNTVMNEGKIPDPKDSDEKSKQLEILKDVLGKPVSSKQERKTKVLSNRMLRFDPTKPEHARFEVKVYEKGQDTIKEEPANTVTEEKPKFCVAKEKFYKISDSLKDAFKNKDKNKEEFSLLKAFGTTEEDIEIKHEVLVNEAAKKSAANGAGNRFSKAVEQPVIAQGVWRESFFFKPDDKRLQEGLLFAKEKAQEELLTEDFTQSRQTLKRIIHSKILLSKSKRSWKDSKKTSKHIKHIKSQKFGKRSR